MSLRSEPSPAKRTTTMPPGSVAVTTPSPNAACTTSSPMRNTWAASAAGTASAPLPPRGLVGELAGDLVDEARAHAERLGAEAVAPAGVGERELAHRARDADVGEPALLLERA